LLSRKEARRGRDREGAVVVGGEGEAGLYMKVDMASSVIHSVAGGARYIFSKVQREIKRKGGFTYF
jgi:hypothetical protein